MAEETYIVALRRSQREHAPADWLERLGATDGVSVVGSSSNRAQITADDASLERVRDELGTWLRIEPVIEHPVIEPVLPAFDDLGDDDGRSP